MGVPEWHDLAALVTSLAAFLVAWMALRNQLASLKRPLPSVDFSSQERIAKTPIPGEAVMEDTVVSTLIIRVTNRGHDPMLNPRVYDTTPGYFVYENPSVAYSMPYELHRGQSVEMVTSYSLANDYDRVIAVVWDEAALFRREPQTRGFRFYVDAARHFEWNVTPEERWTRVGPFGRKGWQRRGRHWSLWRPVTGTYTDPGEGRVWMNTHKHKDFGIYEQERILVKSLIGWDDVIGDQVVDSDVLASMRARGELLPKDKPERWTSAAQRQKSTTGEAE